jgi:hypothetical protein
VEGAAMNAIYGLYSDPDSAQSAVDELRRAGVADRAITVVASQPYEEYEFSHRYKQTWIFWIAAGGGVLGLGIGLALAYITEVFWPIVTGGMPIVESRVYDAEVSNGKILVAVEKPSNVAMIEATLRDTNVDTIKRN